MDNKISVGMMKQFALLAGAKDSNSFQVSVPDLYLEMSLHVEKVETILEAILGAVTIGLFSTSTSSKYLQLDTTNTLSATVRIC
jgi:hypothetical protein